MYLLLLAHYLLILLEILPSSDYNGINIVAWREMARGRFDYPSVTANAVPAPLSGAPRAMFVRGGAGDEIQGDNRGDGCAGV